ncbi:hypothetical protein D9758_013436 [Tetrapyrgos nigripes]|uniref:Heterokaryon incompatibility domain-containing protein n=1 Tax=Tetrapyrgos nigripes TaxID=182062 RepID=A0A8H5CLY6_9AGAR|nr:hypothetical protein D9758_013436 [Tetrapyrgos nigripes]
MRLLNTDTLQLKSFFGGDIPPYAILSHTWGKTEDEVTFQDMMAEDHSVAEGKAGYKKIRGACLYAQKYKFEWIWIDSCCINKESSAELSEAINSMYSYYEDSEVCYVYLEEAVCSEDIRDAGSEFRNCKWFTRGWTLQELLAPSYVVFLDKDWKMLGTRYSLADAVSVITSIPESVFKDGNFDRFSVAQKMSWASMRQTTRPEDQAYCLLGIFGVSMPPIYGEGGARAFMRLQQEIINISDDRSIFAWVAPYGQGSFRGLLARSPFEFRMSGEVRASESDVIGDSSFSFGNNGLRIHLPLRSIEPVPPVDTEAREPVRSFPWSPWSSTSAPNSIRERSYREGTIFFAPLHCRSDRDPENCFAVYLQKVAGGRYVRYRPDQLPIIPTTSQLQRDMRQVVVKENAGIPRKVKNDCNFGDHHGNLSIRTTPGVFLRYDHQHPLSRVIDREEKEQAIGETLLEIIRRPAGTPSETWAIANLKYRCAKSGDIFFIDLGFYDNAFLRFSMRNYSEELPQWINDPCLDWMQFHMKGPGLVTITYQMTGDRKLRIFEVEYKAPAIAHTPRLFQPTTLGFMVPSMFRENVKSSIGETLQGKIFSLESVFPRDFFGKEYRGQTYVDMSDIQDAQRMLRVLKYKSYNRHPKDKIRKCVYVVLGLHGSSAWADVIIQRDPQIEGLMKDIWESYLDSGPRAEKRLQPSPRASLGDATYAPILHGSRRPSVIVDVKERTTLHLGSHLVDISYSSLR